MVRTTQPRPIKHPACSVLGDGRGIMTRTDVGALSGCFPRIAAPEALMFSVVPECHSASPATRYHTGKCSAKRCARTGPVDSRLSLCGMTSVPKQARRRRQFRYRGKREDFWQKPGVGEKFPG